jgi:hypothetical protein
MDVRDKIIKLTTALPEVGLAEVLDFVLLMQSKYSVANVKNVKKKTRGSLHKYANPGLIPHEKGAWERAVVENYAK